MTVYNLEIIISFVLLLLHDVFKYLGFALTNNHLTVYSFGMSRSRSGFKIPVNPCDGMIPLAMIHKMIGSWITNPDHPEECTFKVLMAWKSFCDNDSGSSIQV